MNAPSVTYGSLPQHSYGLYATGLFTDGVIAAAPGVDITMNTSSGGKVKYNGNEVLSDTTAWTPPYTPTLSCGSGMLANASAVGHYKQLGKSVNVSIAITITANGTCAGRINATLPPSLPTGNVDAANAASFSGVETVVTAKALSVFVPQNSQTVQIRLYDATYPGGSGYVLTVSGVYETS